MKLPGSSGDVLGGLAERLPRRLVIGVAIIAVVAVGGWLLVGNLLGDRSASTARAWNDAYQQIAGGIARSVAGELTPYTRALDAIASNPEVTAAFAAGDSAALAALADRLRPQLDGVLALRLLPADLRDPEPEASPPLTFASISMLRRAREEGASPAAEVHLAGTEAEHMVFLEPVMAADEDETLLGFVHLSVHPDIVRRVLEANPPRSVYAELRQGTRVQLASTGTAPADGAPSTTARVAGTTLAVTLRAPGAAVADGGGPGIATIAAGVVGVMALIGAVIFLRGQRQGVRVATPAAGTRIYQGAIKAIYDGVHPGLEQLMPGARAAATDIDLDVLDDGAAGDDVTAFKNPAALVDDEDPTVPRTTSEAVAAGDTDLEETPAPVPASIFRSYDIRGIVGETLTEDGVYQIGRALGAEAEARGQKTVVVARDGRHSSTGLREALTRGLLESGRDVLDIGLTPTPVLYFATHHLDARSGVMITGSHNPAQYNGLKIVLDGETLSGEAIQAIRRRVEEQDFTEGTGSLQSTDIVAEYIRRISEEIPVTLGKAMRVVVDCGNGVPGAVAPDILRAIGHDVIELFCEVDGDFPNHHPDPSQTENLEALIQAVADEGADLGLAFDGDGDRLGVVDSEGNVIWPDRQMILFARDILSRNPGAKIIYDVKCSRLLGAEITAHGGEPIMSKTGHSLIKSKMQETGALLAGEMSGHIFFKERWYGFDDALYSAARLLEILVNSDQSPAEVFASLPGGVATPELRLDMPEEAHAGFMEKVLAAAAFDDAEVTTIDGLRVDFADSWGLIRPSNTTPCLVLRFEGDDEAALEGVKARFRELLLGVDASLELPF